MAKCPVCNHDVRTPLFLNLEAWAHLRCTNCQTRLEMKPPRYGVGMGAYACARKTQPLLRGDCFRLHVRHNVSGSF